MHRTVQAFRPQFLFVVTEAVVFYHQLNKLNVNMFLVIPGAHTMIAGKALLRALQSSPTFHFSKTQVRAGLLLNLEYALQVIPLFI